MLIRNKSLSRSLNDFSYRNHLIKQLKYPKEKKHALYKRILGFWLGSNIIYTSTPPDISLADKTWGLIYYGYYCFLILDKSISTTAPDSPEFKVIRRCQGKLLKYYNNHYFILMNDPDKFFEKFCDIIKEMDQSNLFYQSIYQQFIRKIQTLCLNEMNRHLTSDNKNFKSALNETTQKMITISSVRDIFKLDAIRIFATKMLTQSFQLHPFFHSSPINETFFSKQIRFHKLFIPARDGVILEGLLVENAQQKSNIKVLALAGHFQIEHKYFNNCFVKFQQLFGHDVIFLNYRNYSLRSSRSAKNIEELADDVAQFAEFFASRNQQIVLYGMCGGAAHMALAGNILQNRNIPCKMILDRTFAKYSHCLDIKTQLREHKCCFLNESQKSLPVKMMLVLTSFFQILLLFILKELFFRFTNSDYHFGNLVRTFPENNLLILQAKSKKSKDKAYPEYTDFFVHPRNDMRHALKDKRHQNRMIIKKFAEHCASLVRLDKFNIADTLIAFSELKNHFMKCLELIDNEKLTLDKQPDKKINNLHEHKLFELTTRNNLPIRQFLSGFFSKPKDTCDKTVSSIIVYTNESILSALKKLQPDEPFESNAHANAAYELHHFLKNLKQHDKFICYMGDRLLATGLGNFNQSLLKLLDSKLFTTLSYSLPRLLPSRLQ